MATHRSSATDDELDRTITIRVTSADDDLLDRIASSEVYKLARRGAVAREALRRGLAELRADVAPSTNAK